MGIGGSSDRDDKLGEALLLLEQALKLLDEADAPAQIGAHVDLGVGQLRAALDARRPMNDERWSGAPPPRQAASE